MIVVIGLPAQRHQSPELIKDEQVLLILIKPRIIIPAEAEEEAFPTFSAS